jgi:YidC/Oxa1 family membrane protein insertase
LAEIRNPNQPGGGGQDSRTLLIFSVVFVLIFLGLQYFGPKKKAQPETPTEVASPSAPKAMVAPAPAATAVPAPGKASADAVVAAAETTTVVENAVARPSPGF